MTHSYAGVNLSDRWPRFGSSGRRALSLRSGHIDACGSATPLGEGRQTMSATGESLLRLQRLLLPDELPSIACTEAAAGYRAANDTFRLGGDWFDIVDRPRNNTVVAIIGDVVGHGLEEISVMGQLRAATRALTLAVDEAHDIVSHVDHFSRGMSAARGTSLAVAVLDGSGTVRISLAGHPPPVVVRDGVAYVERLAHGPLLGILPAPMHLTSTFAADEGDVVVLYTDGVTDQFERRHGADGAAALAAFVAERPEESCQSIAVAILDLFCEAHDDDQAVVVLRPIRHADAGTFNRPQPRSHVTFRT